MAETAAAYKAALVRPLSRWLKLVDPDAPFRLPLGSADGGKILFVQSGDITDVLFAAPLVSALQRAYPRCRIGMLVRDDSVELVRHHPHIHDMMPFQPGKLALADPRFVKMARRLRKQGYDMVIHMGSHPTPAHELLGYLTGAPVRIGPQHEGSYPYVNCEMRRDAAHPTYEGFRLGNVAGLFGIEPGTDRLSALLTDQDVRFAKQLVHFRKPRRDQILIGVDPGRGKSHTRVRDRTLAYLTTAIYKRYRSKVIVLSTPEEDDLAERFEAGLKCECIDLPRHNIKDVVALLSQCDLFLAGNTNLLHFAVAFGVPTIGLFTERDGARWTPPDLDHVALIRGRRGAKLALSDFLAHVERLLRARDRLSSA